MKRLLMSAALSLFAMTAQAADIEANKKAVLEFYEKGLNQKDFDAASKYFGPKYVQHNPGAPDGIEGFKAFIAQRKEKFPKAKNEIKRAFADGDYVILHVHGVREPGEAQRRRQHRQHDGDQRGAPLDPFGERADEGAEQRHRQHAQHRHQRDVESRAGVLIDKDADHQHLEPAHREGNDADRPQAAEIGARQQAPAPAATPAFGAGEDGGRVHGLSGSTLAPAAKPRQQQLVQTHVTLILRRSLPTVVAWRRAGVV